jgi:hypothetical protein
MLSYSPSLQVLSMCHTLCIVGTIGRGGLCDLTAKSCTVHTEHSIHLLASDRGINVTVDTINERFEVFTAVTMKKGEEWCLLGCYALWLL